MNQVPDHKKYYFENVEEATKTATFQTTCQQCLKEIKVEEKIQLQLEKDFGKTRWVHAECPKPKEDPFKTAEEIVRESLDFSALVTAIKELEERIQKLENPEAMDRIRKLEDRVPPLGTDTAYHQNLED